MGGEEGRRGPIYYYDIHITIIDVHLIDQNTQKVKCESLCPEKKDSINNANTFGRSERTLLVL